MKSLRDEARRDLGRAAEAILAALGQSEIDDDDERALAMVGALVFAEAAHDLRLLRQGLVETRRG